MANKDLKRLIELSAEFKDAVEAKFTTPRMQRKIMATLQPGELESVQELLMEVVSEGLVYAFGGEPSEDFLKKNLKIIELTAEFGSRVLPISDLAAELPEELKNEIDAAAFRAAGAPTLAKIAEYKPA